MPALFLHTITKDAVKLAAWQAFSPAVFQLLANECNCCQKVNVMQKSYLLSFSPLCNRLADLHLQLLIKRA